MENVQKDTTAVKSFVDDYTPERIEMFNSLFTSWSQVCDVPAVIEGLTFEFNGIKTKITGGFATLNQLLGVCRYGRGNVPPVTTTSENKKVQSRQVSISPEWFALE